MARYVTVVQIETDENGSPIQDGSRFVRYAIIDRAMKNKTFFSGRSHEVCKKRAMELNDISTPKAELTFTEAVKATIKQEEAAAEGVPTETAVAE